jgi:molybdate transport system ATP-binding protein
MVKGLLADVASAPNGFRIDARFSVPAGTTAALLGPNGAGKSTVLRAIAGLTPLERGRIELGDRVLDDPGAGVFVPAEDRRIGMVFQDGVLFPRMTVSENVAFGLRSAGLARREARDAASHWLARLGVGDLGGRMPGELSGGQAQRVALARALAAEPDLLLLDEPLSSLDVAVRADIRHVLAEHLAGFGGPRVLVTHDPADAHLLADQIHVMEGGVVTQSGTPEEVRIGPRTRYAADLAGANLLEGIAEAGVVDVRGHVLHVADAGISGPVLVTIHARAISLHRRQPTGSPRNTWQTRLARVEHLGDRVRVLTDAPLPLAAEVTPGAVEALDLAPGVDVWVSIKATEIDVVSD